MKFSATSSDLLKALQMVGGAIGSNPVLPILEDFLFDLKGNVLTISASDLETSIVTKLEVSASEEGLIAVPARILLDTLKGLPQQPVSFESDPDTFTIQLTSAYGKYKLAGENGQEFPEIPSDSEVDKITIDSAVLSQAIAKSLFATSNDELRPAMSGVYFQVDFNKIIFVATDAHKLVKFAYTGIESDVSTNFVVPKKSLNLLKGTLPNTGEVTLSFNHSNAFFSIGNVLLVCRLIDARYPDYNAVIPVDNPNSVTVTRTDLLSSLKRIAIYSNKTTNQVIFSISDGSMTISAQDLDFSNEATEQMVCSLEGEGMTIGFNAKFLIEMLNVLESDSVKIELSTPTRAGILLPEEANENEEILMLVMPVMLSN